MGEAKRRKQILGDQYGVKSNLEKISVPSEISLAYVEDEALERAIITKIRNMSRSHKTMMLMAFIKAKTEDEPGIVIAENTNFMGDASVTVEFRKDIEVLLKSKCNSSSQVSSILQELNNLDYRNYRAVAILVGSKTPIMAINIYTINQIETLLNSI